MAKSVFIDLAGVIYQGDSVIAGSVDAIGRLRAAGIPVRFLTNTTRTPRRLIAAQLQRMGVAVGQDELFTPARSACEWLAERGMRAHLLVHPALVEDFADCGSVEDGPEDGAEAVVVGDAGDEFSYAALNAAFRKLVSGAPLLALARNRTFLDADGVLSLDAGAFVSGLEYAARTGAVLLGKPSPDFFATAVASAGCLADEVTMIGDDAEADVAGALTAGIGHAVLVRTGKYRVGDETVFSPYPSMVADDLAAAVNRLLG